jgi:hypothetical protein
MRILDERVWRGRRRTPGCACPRPPRPSTTVLSYGSRWPVTVWYLIGKGQVGADGRECHRLGDRCMRVRRLPRFGARVHACVDLFGAPIFTELDRPIAAEIGKVLRTFKLCSDGFRRLGSQSWRLNACLEVDLNNILNVRACVYFCCPVMFHFHAILQCVVTSGGQCFFWSATELAIFTRLFLPSKDRISRLWSLYSVKSLECLRESFNIANRHVQYQLSA